MDKKRKVGRPPKFESPKEVIVLINKYLEDTQEDQLCLTGLCLALGTNKQTLSDYEEKSIFAAVIKEAKMIVEHSYELSLRKHGRTGDIFALKNFGWKDKYETDMTSKGERLEGIVVSFQKP